MGRKADAHNDISTDSNRRRNACCGRTLVKRLTDSTDIFRVSASLLPNFKLRVWGLFLRVREDQNRVCVNIRKYLNVWFEQCECSCCNRYDNLLTGNLNRITPAECSISRIPRSKSIDLGSYNPGHKFGGAMRKFEWTENKSIGSQHEFYAAA
jgi:hypothetical protein